MSGMNTAIMSRLEAPTPVLTKPFDVSGHEQTIQSVNLRKALQFQVETGFPLARKDHFPLRVFLGPDDARTFADHYRVRKQGVNFELISKPSPWGRG